MFYVVHMTVGYDFHSKNKGSQVNFFRNPIYLIEYQNWENWYLCSSNVIIHKAYTIRENQQFIEYYK